MLKYGIMHVITLIFAVLTVISALVLGIMNKKSIISIVLFCITIVLNYMTRVIEKRKMKIDEKNMEEIFKNTKK